MQTKQIEITTIDKLTLDKPLIEEILRCWRPKDARCGKLIQRKSAVWHYSVALSSRRAIAWSGEPHNTGHLDVHDIGVEFTNTVNVVYFEKERVLENILGSISAFHNVWQYGWGWNCEHWARLVATGEPRSFQMDNSLFGLLGLLGLCYRSEAIPQLIGQVSHFGAGRELAVKR